MIIFFDFTLNLMSDYFKDLALRLSENETALICKINTQNVNKVLKDVILV